MVRYNCSARLKNLFFYGHGTGVYCAIDEVVLFLYFSPSVSAVTLVGLHVIKSDFFIRTTSILLGRVRVYGNLAN